MTEAILRCEQVYKSFQDGQTEVAVLKGVDLSVAVGESVAIIGPSGAGKSTLLHCLGGLDNPTAGKVWLDKQDLHALSESSRCRLRNSTLGFVYQFHHLLAEFTAHENVAMPLLIGGTPIEEAKHHAESILTAVGLGHRLSHKLSQLSGGERQRTAIARALVTRPLCLLADEPTGNLDSKTAEKVYDTLFELNREMRTSLLIVTHDLRLASRLDRTVTLEDGRLVEIG